jgi:glycosyltransferase involved in cell wall biosynthesis
VRLIYFPRLSWSIFDIMKNTLLLLMTPNMSLQKWKAIGQLNREIDLYNSLIKAAGLKLLIFSYGRNDQHLVEDYPDIKVLNMPSWIPAKIPFKLQNLIYETIAPWYYRKYFKTVILSKTNQFAAGRFGLILKFLFSMPLVIRMGYYYSHFQPISKIRSIKEQFFFRFCDKVIVTSAAAKEFISETYHIPANKILWMCNSIDQNVFKPQAIEKEFDVVCVGRLEKRKNIKLLLKTINRASLKALIIGKGSLAGYMSDCVANNSKITWVESVRNSDLPGYYSKAHAFLILSDFEGCPKSLLEAMACGIPCLGTNVPGITECLDDEQNGLLVEKNTDDIEKKLILINNDQLLAKRLTNNAIKWVSNNCELETNVRKELELFKDAINAKYKNTPFNTPVNRANTPVSI